MPTPLLVGCDCHPPESCRLSVYVDTNDTDRCFLEQKQLWEMVGFEFIRMVGIINAEAPSVFKQDDPSNVVVNLPKGRVIG